MGVSRREFLKDVGIVGAGLVAGAVLGHELPPPEKEKVASRRTTYWATTESSFAFPDPRVSDVLAEKIRSGEVSLSQEETFLRALGDPDLGNNVETFYSRDAWKGVVENELHPQYDLKGLAIAAKKAKISQVPDGSFWVLDLPYEKVMAGYNSIDINDYSAANAYSAGRYGVKHPEVKGVKDAYCLDTVDQENGFNMLYGEYFPPIDVKQTRLEVFLIPAQIVKDGTPVDNPAIPYLAALSPDHQLPGNCLVVGLQSGEIELKIERSLVLSRLGMNFHKPDGTTESGMTSITMLLTSQEFSLSS